MQNEKKYEGQFDAIGMNQHKETMRYYCLIQNAAVLLVFVIVCLIVRQWWVLFLLFLWDWSYRKKEEVKVAASKTFEERLEEKRKEVSRLK